MRKFLTLVIFALCPLLMRAQGDFNYVALYGPGMCAVASSEGDIHVYTLEGSFHNQIHVSARPVNAVASFAGMLFCACDGGMMAAVTSDGRVLELKSPKGEDVTCLAEFDGHLIAAGDKGLLFCIAPDLSAVPVSTKAKGRFVGVAAGDNECYALTDRGEFLRSRDGLSWTLFNFNDYYRGYYPEIRFRGMAAGGGQIMIAGLKPEGSPAMFLSVGGSVWSERPLVYTDSDGSSSMLRQAMLCAAYDASQDRFVLGCAGGYVFTIPGCSHCHKLQYLADDDIRSIHFHGRSCVICGRDGLLLFDGSVE